MRKIVKARLTARGFKDLQAYQENVSTFSGTATKAGQRAVCGFSAQHSYTLFSLDISAAFLKGLTFKEVQDVVAHSRLLCCDGLQYSVDRPCLP